ncbi:PaaI family thioesterase [Bradyrhizobium sp. NP1]|uniref:PaaI family thioesterase n=1 Tax=Bradyrhizobium sp. NP1 TaxID=3049772 RepID=UPI0025A58E82|nr:PaaI family thioesterase [Bradyrhizobium sp. NP1]WJR80392.1 PaaI family thioesterase [Bradyrhizobium sp. NP1]
MGTMSAHKSGISTSEFNDILRATMPAAIFFGIQAERIDPGVALLRLDYSPKILRPGGTHGGPSMMALIDLAMYAVVLSLDADSTGALTTQLAVQFLQRPAATDLLAECRMLHASEATSVGRCIVFPATNPETILCTSTCSYAIPAPKPG